MFLRFGEIIDTGARLAFVFAAWRERDAGAPQEKYMEPRRVVERSGLWDPLTRGFLQKCEGGIGEERQPDGKSIEVLKLLLLAQIRVFLCQISTLSKWNLEKRFRKHTAPDACQMRSRCQVCPADAEQMPGLSCRCS